MLSGDSLEQYRCMTPTERFRLTLHMIEEETPYLFRGSPEQIDRRFELLHLQNEDRNRRMLTGIARTRDVQ
jgi:hypothetical protein